MKQNLAGKPPRIKYYDYLVSPAPDSFLSSIPDSLVGSITAIPYDAENEEDTEQNKYSDTVDLSEEPPNSDAGKDTCQFVCSYESDSLVDSMTLTPLDAENDKNTDQKVCSDIATLPNIPAP